MTDLQAVVFVRVNNMETLEVAGQRTFVVDLDRDHDGVSLDALVRSALHKALDE